MGEGEREIERVRDRERGRGSDRERESEKETERDITRATEIWAPGNLIRRQSGRVNRLGLEGRGRSEQRQQCFWCQM